MGRRDVLQCQDGGESGLLDDNVWLRKVSIVGIGVKVSPLPPVPKSRERFRSEPPLEEIRQGAQAAESRSSFLGREMLNDDLSDQ